MGHLGDRGIREHISSEVAARFATNSEIHQPNCSCPNQRRQENKLIVKCTDKGQNFLEEKALFYLGACESPWLVPSLPLSALTLRSLFPSRLVLKMGTARGNAALRVQ